MLSSPLVIYFCDWDVFTLSGGEQLGVQHPATKCYSSCPIFRPTSIDAGWCTRPFFLSEIWDSLKTHLVLLRTGLSTWALVSRAEFIG